MEATRIEIGAVVTSRGKRWKLQFETIDGKWFARLENQPAITAVLDLDEINTKEEE